ncbi:hypothetical protein [Brevibacillus borstelensis]|uniref:hypothetical protein n=1 Tax=Brevibacillus borstelensis TaxID=45462 RepID=UPI00287FAB65|nr:hypothetical protein [Brevibacillus borstelensis]WNF07247.1 hypothetical protein RFB14_07415 [Brevibacillus borstelensis]
MQRDAEKDLVMCERATPGPWNNDHDQVTKENGVPLFKAFRMRGDLQMRDDARFITEAREALPYWIKRAIAAEQHIEAAKSLIKSIIFAYDNGTTLPSSIVEELYAVNRKLSDREDE